MTDLERMELACRKARDRLGQLEFSERRTLSVLIDELVLMNIEQNRKPNARSE
jgi:hypothetical protein